MSQTLEFKWTVSRGRDTYGYNICTLYVDGRKVSACNGGGYDMEGTALGNWLARAYADRLRALKPEQMEAQSHWERAENPRRVCTNMRCAWTNKQITDAAERDGEPSNADYFLPHDAFTCPHCGSETRVDHHDGKRVDDGRYFYGLTYHDPNYNPAKAVIGKDCLDRTFGAGSEGKTVEQAETDGDSLGLERYQAFYSASSKTPTERHTVPLIDGACGKDAVKRIGKAIGLEFEFVPVRSRKVNLYRLHDTQEAAQ